MIMINRSDNAAEVALTVSDVNDDYESWKADICPNGVQCFDINQAQVANLVPEALRLRVDGMPTPWGRPIVFKEFHNGSISVMHC